MTEIDLIDLGFRRNEVTSEESGTEEGYYFYVCDLSEDNYQFCLISNENDNTINGKWWVEFMEVKDYKYFERSEIENIIKAIKI